VCVDKWGGRNHLRRFDIGISVEIRTQHYYHHSSPSILADRIYDSWPSRDWP